MREAEMYLRMIPQAEIAKELAISEATVSRDLKSLQSQWRETSLMNMNEAKQRELARIDVLEREYWQAWERSQKEAKARAEVVVGPGQIEELESSRDQYGDPRFLNGVMQCIQKRCEILGLDAPKKSELTGGGKQTWAQFIGVQVISPALERPSGEEPVDGEATEVVRPVLPEVVDAEPAGRS